MCSPNASPHVQALERAHVFAGGNSCRAVGGGSECAICMTCDSALSTTAIHFKSARNSAGRALYSCCRLAATETHMCSQHRGKDLDTVQLRSAVHVSIATLAWVMSLVDFYPEMIPPKVWEEGA